MFPRLRYSPVLRFTLGTLCVAVLFVASSVGLALKARVWTRVAILRGHASHVHHILFSPDGGLIASTSYDGACIIWDNVTLEQRHLLKGNESLLANPSPLSSSVARVPPGATSFAGNGVLAATANGDGTVRVWSLEDGKQVSVFDTGGERVSCVALSPDGSLVVGAGDSLRVWKVSSEREESLLLPGHVGWIYSAAFSADGSRLVTASADGTACIWDVKSAKLIGTLQGNAGAVYLAVFSPDGNAILTTAYDAAVRVWDWKNGKCLSVFHPKEDKTGWTRVLPIRESAIVISSFGMVLLFYDLKTQQELAQIPMTLGVNICAGVSPDGDRIAVPDGDTGNIGIWVRHRPSGGWGLLEVPELWLTLVTGTWLLIRMLVRHRVGVPGRIDIASAVELNMYEKRPKIEGLTGLKRKTGEV